MRVLVLAGSTNESSYQAINTYLNEIGVPHQVVNLSSVSADSSGNRLSGIALSDSTNGRGNYQGIIITDSTFAACGSSCLSAADWTALNTYASQFSVRIASYYTLPAAQWGLVPVDSGADYTTATPLNVTLTAAGAAVFPYLNSANAIPVAGEGTSGIRAYRATPVAATNEVTTPLLTVGSNTVAVTHTSADGRESLALTMNHSPSLLHSTAFGYGVINWVTKGVFLGSRKVFLNPQFDDMLLGNWLYAPSQHPRCESGASCPTYFATGPDLRAMANWQDNLRLDPQFQSYRTTYAYNGVGTTWFPSTDPIFSAIKSLNSEFWWLSHTWDHASLDCYSVSNSGACLPATSAQSLSELNQNINVAPTLGVTLDRISMVTPYNSGLTNVNFLQAAAQTGIKYIVIPQLPANPNTGIVNSLVPSILQITRLNNNIFDDASSPLTGVPGSWPDEYNDHYGPNGATPTYSQNQTYNQILAIESRTFLQNMLTYAPYPLALHISNAATYDGVHSIYTDLMDATIAKYKATFTLPVLTVNMEDIGAMLASRSAYNASGVVGIYTPGVSVVLTTTRAATIPLTGICSQQSCGTYGGQVQDEVTMAANATVTIPLTTNVGVSLSALTINPSSVGSGTSATGTVTLSGSAPSGGVAVALSSGNASATVPASVLVPTGSNTATFSVSTGTVSSSVSTTITASYNGVSKTSSLTVTSPATAVSLSALSITPSSVSGGTSATGTLTLSGSAPAGGISIAVASSSAAATTPATVTVPAGSSTATFTVSTTTVNSSVSATLTGTYNGVSRTSSLTVVPVAAVSLSSVSISPASVTSGASLTGTVTLTAIAPTGGVSVTLTSSSSFATVPASITVPAGSTSATFNVTTRSVGSTTSVTVTGSYSGVSKTSAFTITPIATVALSSVSVSPTSVASSGATNGTATGTVTLTAPAPTGGIVVELWTTGEAAYVPDQVTVVGGSTTATFTVTTNYTTSVKQDTITAFYNGVSKTTPITVTP